MATGVNPSVVRNSVENEAGRSRRKSDEAARRRRGTLFLVSRYSGKSLPSWLDPNSHCNFCIFVVHYFCGTLVGEF